MRKLAAVPIGELFSGPANREKCRGCSVCSEDGEENDERRGLVGGNHINARGEGEEKKEHSTRSRRPLQLAFILEYGTVIVLP